MLWVHYVNGTGHWKAYNECTQTPLGQGHWGRFFFKVCELQHTTEPRIDLPCELLPSLGARRKWRVPF